MLTYEPAREEDILPIYQLNKDLIDRYEDCAAIDYGYVLDWVRENIRAHLPSFRRVLLDGEHAGYFCLSPTKDGWELDSLFVIPRFQNRGIGTQVLRKCLEETDENLFFYVFRANTGALRLYERLGFRIAKEVRKTAYIMEYKKQDC